MPIPALLADAVARDGARPFLTFYDHATGERVELSRTTTVNWVAKTANLLQDTLDAENGSSLLLELTPHWQRTVWLLAAWEVGCVVHAVRAEATDIAVIGPAALPSERPEAAETVALSMRPMNARFGEPLPTGVVDYNAEVLSHGDEFLPDDPVADSTPALVDASGRTRTHGDCLAAAREYAAALAADAPRLLSVGDRDVVGCADLTLGALAADGSIVLVVNPDSGRLDDLAADERVTRRV